MASLQLVALADEDTELASKVLGDRLVMELPQGRTYLLYLNCLLSSIHGIAGKRNPVRFSIAYAARNGGP